MKTKTVDPDLKAIRDALTDDYLAKCPSFERVKAKAAKAGLDVDRDSYAALMHEVHTLKALFKLTDVNHPADAVLKKYVVNYWGNAGNPNYQVKAFMEPKDKLSELIKSVQPRKLNLKGTRTVTPNAPEVMYIPDIHFGYEICGYVLEPFHDEEALVLVLMAAKWAQPSVIVLLGDNLDFPGFSTFKNKSAILHLVNHANQRAYNFLADLREACPHSRIVYIEGNHEYRLQKYIQERAPELSGVRRVNDTHDVNSVPHWLRLDELKIEYVGEYGTHIWIAKVRTLHGELLGSRGGDTVSKMLAAYEDSSVCGHNHRLELAFESKMVAGEWVEVFAMACGTLARRGRIPGPKYPNWQLGFCFLWDIDNPSVHKIRNGRCRIGHTIFDVRGDACAG